MDEVTAEEIHTSMSNRYPNAHRRILDPAYEMMTEEQLKSIYEQFQRSMWKIKLVDWIKNKLDCDKWARLLTSHVIIRNAKSGNDKAQALGELCYRINGDRDRGHMINVAIVKTVDGFRVQEMEPQPNGGLVKLTKKEWDSAWDVSF